MKRSCDIDKDGHIGWRELDFRDKAAYTMAIILIFSGIVMAFLCFFLTGDYSITDGVLFYVSEAFVTGGALLGIATYIKGKFGEITNYIHKKIDNETEA
ncbi:MAG: hypothetical protein J5629_03920 [Muribaculaceae bacterium]|nr:hypothetical protein [Muribaculaceae bacterium]